jgi:hypothetical protein
MIRTGIRRCALTGLVAAFLLSPAAYAHSASNAYLTLTVQPGDPVVHVQWDVALRDLEFVLGINRAGDGKLTWGELLDRRDDVTRYVYSHIAFSAAERPCAVSANAFQVDEHSDGAYAVLTFEVRCGDRPPASLDLNYSLFFDVDPTHRGIVVARAGNQVSTAVASPDNARIRLKF